MVEEYLALEVLVGSRCEELQEAEEVDSEKNIVEDTVVVDEDFQMMVVMVLT